MSRKAKFLLVSRPKNKLITLAKSLLQLVNLDMTSEQARKYTVIFMFVLTVVVGVAAVYIGIRLQQDQRPTDSAASGLVCPTGGAQAAWCIVFRCPSGDTNGDGKCQTGDTGATEQYSSDPNVCNATPGGCYQIDFFLNPPATNTNATPANFCGAKLDLSCPPPTSSTTTTSTTSTAPAQVCQQVKLVNEGTYSDADGDGDLNSDGVIVKDIKVGQTVTFRGIIANCDRNATNDTQKDKMRLVVFSGQDQADYDGTKNVGTPIPAVVTAAEYGGGLCKYDFTWTATNVPVLTTGNYKVRMAKDGQGGGNPEDGIIQAADIYWEPAACRYKVDIIPVDAPVCGDTCSTRTDCPTDHACSAGKCVLNACLEGADCDAAMCNVDVDLPDTGLFDEDGRPMLVGLLLILFGLVVNRMTGGMSLIMTNAGQWMDGMFTANAADVEKAQRQYDDEYEQKILDKTKK